MLNSRNVKAWAVLAVAAGLFAMMGQTCLPPPPPDLAVDATASPTSGTNSVAVTLTATVTEGTAATYAWTASPATTITNADAASASATVTATTTFTCTVTDADGATATDTATVTVTTAITVTISGSTTASGGDAIGLTALAANSTGAVSFSWLQTAVGTAGTGTLSNQSSQTATVTFSNDASGTFTFQVTATDSAGSDSETISVVVTPSGTSTATTFTNGTDDLTGTTGNDEFDGSMYYNAGANAWLMTVGSADQADGLDGDDVLNMELDEGVTVNPTLANIEEVNILVTNNVDSGAAAATFNASKTTGMTDLGIAHSVAALTVSNLQEIPALALTDMGANLTLTFDADAVSESDDTLALTVDGASTGTITMPETIEAMTIATTGSASVIDDIIDSTSAGDATGLGEITITGDQDLSLAAAATLDTSVDVIDASAFTGDLTVIFGNATSDAIEVTGGSGDDAVTAGTTGDAVTAVMGAGDDTLTLGGFTDATDDVDGGDGTDTIVLPTASVGIATAVTTLANFEVLNVSDANTSSINLTYWGGITDIVLAAGVGGAHTLTVANGAEITIEAAAAGADALGITVSGTGTSDAVSLILDTTTTAAGGLTTLTGVETLAIESTGGANALTSVTFSPSAGVSAATVTITGDEDLTMGTVTAGTPISATAFTGILNLTLGQAGTVTGGEGDDILNGSANADSISGGDGDDTIVGNAGNDAINGGAGDDTITSSAGDDVVAGGEGLDTFAIGNGAGTTSDTISDFSADDEDVISIDVSDVNAVVTDLRNGDGTTATAGGDTVQFGEFANGAAYTADAADNIFVISDTTGIDSYADVDLSGSITLVANTTGNGDGVILMYYDEDGAAAVIGVVVDTDSDADAEINASNDTFNIMATIPMTAAEYTALTTDSFAFQN